MQRESLALGSTDVEGKRASHFFSGWLLFISAVVVSPVRFHRISINVVDDSNGEEE